MSKKKTTTKSKSKKPAKASDPDIVPLKEAMAKPGKEKRNGTPPPLPSSSKPKKLSCLDAAAQLLKTKGEAMNCKGLIDAMFAGKLWHSDAPTPAATLYSAILRELQTKKNAARFKKTDRGLFAFNG